MCGLCGLALHDPRRSPDVARLEAAAHTLRLRGPDDQGVFVRGPLGLAFRRLAIIDVAGGHQPILNETQDVALVLNGEIYNHLELRAELEARGHRFRTRSDVEVAVHLYEEVGERLVERLVGMFAFALLDYRQPAAPRLLLARDRLGIKPLYFAETAEGLVFGSESKALFELGFERRELDPRKLLDFLVSGYVGGPQSAWAGMQRLPPGHTLTWQPGGRALLRRYWDLPLDAHTPSPEPDELLGWLDRVVREHLMSDVSLGAFLSGGIDSNAVVESMSRSGSQVIACSVGFREKSHDELDLARASAARVGARHHTRVLDPDPKLAVEVLPWVFDEPHADPSNLPTYLVSKMAREHVTVALSGDGGDEVFAGYRRYVHDLAENRLRARIGGGGRALAAALGARYPKLDWAPRGLRAKTFLSNLGRDPARAYWHSVCQLDRAAALELLAPDLRAHLFDHDPFDAFGEHYRRPRIDDPLYRAQYADFHTYLPDQILTKVDRAAMAVSLEVRPPLLDHRFVERFAPLAASEKVRGARGKHVLRETLRSRLPGSILDGHKRGFDTPLKRWIAGELSQSVAEAIESLPADWFDRAALRARWQEHRAGARDHGRLLWSLLVLEHWRRQHGVRGLSA